MTADHVYEVIALRYGTLPTTRSAAYHRWDTYGDPDGAIALDYFCYVLRSPARTVVVDTGFSTASATARGRSPLVEPIEGLAALGVTPETTDLLILTHLHYDHIGNVGAFPDTPIVAPQRELDFYRSAVSRSTHYALHVDRDDVDAVLAADDAGRVTGLGQVVEVEPGITATDVGGHSPGQVVLDVHTADGTIVLCSDAVHFYEELASDRPFGVFSNLAEMYEAFAWLRSRQDDGTTLVAGHDPEVMTRFERLDVDGVEAVRIA